MSDAFVRGGSGTIRLDQIPASRGKAFWMKHEQELAADLYEAEHPGVTVIRPWESDAQLKARVAKRKPLDFTEPQLSISPDRARRELWLKMQELESLPLDHAKYDELFAAHVRNIHLLEEALGQQKTRFVKGVAVKKGETQVAPELVEKLAKYKALGTDKRRQSIEKGQNIELLVLIQSVETDSVLRDLAMARIGQLGMATKETPVT